MANIRSVKKHIKLTEKRRKRNISNKSMIRTFIKKVHNAIFTKDKKKAHDAFCKMQSILDRNVLKGLIHKRKAARYKSKFYAEISKLL